MASTAGPSKAHSTSKDVQLPTHPSFVKWFDEIAIEDVLSVGGKNASLGEMYQQLTSKGITVPNGFAVTADAYRLLIESNDLSARIRKALGGLDVTNTRKLQQRGEYVRELIMLADFPKVLKEQIAIEYRKLEAQYGDGCSVAVRSSATAEDLPDASFAGQQGRWCVLCELLRVSLNVVCLLSRSLLSVVEARVKCCSFCTCTQSGASS
jgi:phosphoenolpyruvate synthase/pyruvate phosphate dikinase